MAHPPSSEKGPSSKSSSDPGRAPLKFHFLTLFPEALAPFLASSLLGKAQSRGLASFNLVQIRDFARDSHRTVDDTPYGGGDGMLLKVDVLYDAWKSIVGDRRAEVRTCLLSPQGPLFTQDKAKQLAKDQEIVLVCGHYEGVDERFIELCVDEEISIGDYVLTGGELAAGIVVDAVTRLIPGVVGKEGSVAGDSLEGGVLKYPQYTRPREFQGAAVPEVLLSGDHGAIAKWREKQSRERTKRKRPDLA